MRGSLLYRLLFSLAFLTPTLVLARETDLTEQHNRYRAAQMALSRGETRNFVELTESLKDYPLYPWLRYEQISRRRSSAKAAEIDAFFEAWGDDLVGKTLRTKLLDTYFSQQRWQDYLRVAEPAPIKEERRCERAWALLKTGDVANAFSEASRIWPQGKSLPRVCDPLFERWYSAGNPAADLAWQRFHLAMNADQGHLAEYLKRFLDASMKRDAELYLQIRQDPARVKRIKPEAALTARQAQMVEYGIGRLSRKHPRDASELFTEYVNAGALNSEAAKTLSRRILVNLASADMERALRWSLGLDDRNRGIELSEDTVRYALRLGQWSLVPETLNRLPQTSQNEERWRYWSLRDGGLTGQADVQDQQWAAISERRSWYAFLASDQINRPYTMEHAPVAATDGELDRIRTQPGIARALAFAEVNNDLMVRREWYHTIPRLSPRERELAARIAFDKGWYQQAMMALISAESWNDLAIRFPALYTDDFKSAASKTRVEPTWLYAIARQESMFDTNARSPAGAVGLMQLMPATARTTARAHGISYGGTGDLKTPRTNVDLGSRYMKSMLNDFDNNRALAAAAYNAGPTRVRQWLKSMPAEIPHDVFVEAIPFRETRQYVQNTLSFAVIYAYLQGQSAPLVREHERIIKNRFAKQS